MLYSTVSTYLSFTFVLIGSNLQPGSELEKVPFFSDAHQFKKRMLTS